MSTTNITKPNTNTNIARRVALGLGAGLVAGLTFGLAGTASADGVSSSDLAVWQSNYGTSTTRNVGDGDVDGRDFLTWQRNYG